MLVPIITFCNLVYSLLVLSTFLTLWHRSCQFHAKFLFIPPLKLSKVIPYLKVTLAALLPYNLLHSTSSQLG